MFRLTREVRFAINAGDADDQWDRPPSNSYGGYPSVAGFATYFTLRVTLRGELQSDSQYLINIKQIDEAARDAVRGLLPVIRTSGPARVLKELVTQFEQRWPQRFESVSLALSPFLICSIDQSDKPMMRLSQKFEFSASHRLHNPSLSDDENRQTFGKCNNALGHGHNYEVQVTLKGEPNESGLIIDVPEFEGTVKEAVIDKFDHKNLNVETAEFKELIPSVENIAMVIYRMLKPKFGDGDRARLASVTVWETPKTWCEYSE
jgi:6-pyruvoyltetrahydropterin/6-carboxytetrahydropterin synthase